MTPPASSTRTEPGAWSYIPSASVSHTSLPPKISQHAYPYFLPVTRADRHTQVHPTVSPREGAILRLTVHPRRLARDTEHLCDFVIERQLGMRLLDALEEVELVLCEVGDGQSDGLGGGVRGEGELVGSLAADGDEDAAALACGCRSGHGEVGASDDAEFDARVDDESEADGILFTPEEAFRAIDRVECPES